MVPINNYFIHSTKITVDVRSARLLVIFVHKFLEFYLPVLHLVQTKYFMFYNAKLSNFVLLSRKIYFYNHLFTEKFGTFSKLISCM